MSIKTELKICMTVSVVMAALSIQLEYNGWAIYFIGLYLAQMYLYNDPKGPK